MPDDIENLQTRLARTFRQSPWSRRLASVCWFASALMGCGGDDASSDPSNNDPSGSAPVTYWQDAQPILEKHCLECHQEGGVAPFSLVGYENAERRAEQISNATGARIMPPWAATSDGTCGTFSDTLALTSAEIDTLAAWAKAGAPIGTPGTEHTPEPPVLEGATELQTPLFLPVAEGSTLAKSDEYRCFLLDVPPGGGFVTGYEVLPGTPEIVHHILATIIDPNAPADQDTTRTNLEQIMALDAESPDREGWPCYSGAGDGVNVKSVPIVWAPGQGVVNFPNDSGVPMAPTDRLIVQVHYNLFDPANWGKTDQTTIKLRMTNSVENVALFLLEDPLLDSMDNEQPDTLAPGLASFQYSWQRSLRELGLGEDVGAELHGIMPHMHELGHRYEMDLGTGADDGACAVRIEQWNFHWQRMYFYDTPYRLTPDSTIKVTCDYDTSRVTEPVLPGWGTSNEMCLATMYVTIPMSAFAQ